MCGIVGVAGLITKNEKDIFRDLLIVDQLRGDHSTGVFVLEQDVNLFTKKENLKYVLQKEVGAPNVFWEKFKDDWPNKRFKGGCNLLIGHNRYATQGKIDADSAHPFEFENLVGVHNGTVSPWSLKEFHEKDSFEIDSQIIYSQINHNPDLSFVWEKAYGAMALVWFDYRDEKLHMIRNHERPLSFAISKDKKSIIWASEMIALQFAIGRNGQFKNYDFEEVEVDREYTFDILIKEPVRVKKHNKLVYKDIKKEVGNKLKKYSFPTNQGSQYHWGGYWEKYGGNKTPKTLKSSNTSSRFIWLTIQEEHIGYDGTINSLVLKGLPNSKLHNYKDKEVFINVSLYDAISKNMWEKMEGEIKKDDVFYVQEGSVLYTRTAEKGTQVWGECLIEDLNKSEIPHPEVEGKKGDVVPFQKKDQK